MRCCRFSLILGSSVMLLWLQSLGGQVRPRAVATAQTFDAQIKPFLARHCTSCHNEKLNTASLNLQGFADEVSAAKKPELWDKVREKLVSGQMPPAGIPAPAPGDVAAVTGWIDSMLK